MALYYTLVVVVVVVVIVASKRSGRSWQKLVVACSILLHDLFRFHHYSYFSLAQHYGAKDATRVEES